jgi:hypothetical protein
MRRKLRKKRLLAVLVVAVAVGGVAAAYFTSAGAGVSTASVGSVDPLTLTPGTASAQLYPGGRAAVVAAISNPNGVAVRIRSLVLDTSRGSGGFGVDDTHQGCDTSALSYTTQSSGWTIPARGTLDVSLGSAVAMTSAGSDACQGAVFTVYLQAGS